MSNFLGRVLSRVIFTVSLLAVCFFFLPRFLSANQEASVVLHVHSAVSSGNPGLQEIARIAKQKKIDAVMMTDLLCERYSYGLAPFQNILKKTVSRKSVWDKGVPAYLSEIQNTDKTVPGVLMMEGVVATPFYYWTGNIWPGPLMLNDRGKDFLVFGLHSASEYENIPVLQSGKSRFDAYHGSKGMAPYQDVIDYVRKKNGFIVWSHPSAEERMVIKLPFNREVVLVSKEYSREVKETEGYDAVGVYSVELAQVIGAPEDRSSASPGGVWDEVLSQYVSGRRKEPVWAVGECDYNGFAKENTELAAILNQVIVPEKTKENIFESLRKGKNYIIIKDRMGAQAMVLNEFSVSDPLTSQSASMGETVIVSAVPKIRFQISFSDQSNTPYHILLIRNGKMIEMEDLSGSGVFEYTDTELPQGDSAYYRIIAYSDGSARLLTNPIFVRRKA